MGAVREYGTLMDRNSATPAPLVWKSNGVYRVLDGLQRLLAAESRKMTSFSAYIVDTDSPAMVLKIRVFSNYRLQGGYQESSDWTLEQAVMLLVNDGSMTVEEIAELGDWTNSQVRDKKQVIDFRLAVRGVGGLNG